MIPGVVQVTGPIGPTSLTDTYPTHSSIYGQGGHVEVADYIALNAISDLRRVPGMMAFVQSDRTYWELLVGPWAHTLSDWSQLALGAGNAGSTITALTQGSYITCDRVLTHAVGAVTWQVSIYTGSLREYWEVNATTDATPSTDATNVYLGVRGKGAWSNDAQFAVLLSGAGSTQELHLAIEVMSSGWTAEVRRLTTLVAGVA